jgi:hypothetical protein
MTEVEELRTPKYAGERLHLEPVTVLRYARKGLIGSVPVGRRRFFRDSDIQAFIDKRAQAPKSAEQSQPRATRNPARTYKS